MKNLYLSTTDLDLTQFVLHLAPADQKSIYCWNKEQLMLL